MEYTDKESPGRLIEIKKQLEAEFETKVEKQKATAEGKTSLSSLLDNPMALQKHVSALQHANMNMK